MGFFQGVCFSVSVLRGTDSNPNSSCRNSSVAGCTVGGEASLAAGWWGESEGRGKGKVMGEGGEGGGVVVILTRENGSQIPRLRGFFPVLRVRVRGRVSVCS